MGIKNYILAATILLWTTGETNATNSSPHHVITIQEMSKQEVRDTLIPPADRYSTNIQRLQKHHPDSVKETIIYFLFNEINNLRESKSLHTLRLDNSLTQAAQAHAQWLAKTKKFQHKWKKDSTPRSRAQKAWYPKDKQIGENIWANYSSIEAAMQAWTISPRHFRTMTNTTYTSIWIGRDWTKRVVMFGQ